LRKKEKKIYKGVRGIGVFFTLSMVRFEFVGFCIDFSSWRWLTSECCSAGVQLQ
jgi:hypothetical protein